MKKIGFPLFLAAILLPCFLANPSQAQTSTPDLIHWQDTTHRWSRARIHDWYQRQPWYCGFNYIPAYAINYSAMWDKTTFDPVAIDKELALAETSGMNVLRLYYSTSYTKMTPPIF